MTDDSRQYDRVADQRDAANPHLHAALRALDEAVESFGGWWPKEPEAAFVVGVLIAASDAIEGQTVETRKRGHVEAEKRLAEALMDHQQGPQ